MIRSKDPLLTFTSTVGEKDYSDRVIYKIGFLLLTTDDSPRSAVYLLELQILFSRFKGNYSRSVLRLHGNIILSQGIVQRRF
jgi:hypothetical protein